MSVHANTFAALLLTNINLLYSVTIHFCIVVIRIGGEHVYCSHEFNFTMKKSITEKYSDSLRNPHLRQASSIIVKQTLDFSSITSVNSRTRLRMNSDMSQCYLIASCLFY